ncbi:MAG: DUF4136 domain-containing protein [Bacteroidia bacterium]|nr:DUF4136 domain-containing protein [Bacteroidia bacterium]HQV00056.1 DUF4136 domain-containing protein [Bacteroidia bacterium]
MKLKSILSISLFILISCTFFSGCYPEGPTYYEEFDVVYTNYKKDYSFKDKKLFTMPDKIVRITGNIGQGQPPVFISEPYNTQIINRIKSNMIAKGYTFTADTTIADFEILTAAIEVENYQVGYWYDYYYPWYYPGYGGGWYYPYPVVSSYTTGSIGINMVERKNTSPNNQNAVVWLSIINGLVEGSNIDFSNRIDKCIDQAYTQSPILNQ